MRHRPCLRKKTVTRPAYLSMVPECDKEAAAGHRVCPLSLSVGVKYQVAAPEVYAEGRCTSAHIDKQNKSRSAT